MPRNHPSVVPNSKKNNNNNNKKQATRQRKLEISNYNLKYPAISNLTVFLTCNYNR